MKFQDSGRFYYDGQFTESRPWNNLSEQCKYGPVSLSETGGTFASPAGYNELLP